MTKQTRRRFILGSAAGAVCAPYVTTAHAQAWPTKPIRIVCAYPAGGLTDIFARAYGEYLQQKLGQPVTVENRSGASGSIGARAVKASEPDGYTLMFTISTALLQNRVLLKNPGYDGDNDFVRIAHMSAGHLPTVAAKPTGIKTIADLVAYAKQRDVSFGTFGAGSYAHITVGVLTAFLAYISRFYTRLDSMSRIVSVTQKAASGAKRIFDILDHVSSVPEPAKPVHLPQISGRIELRDVGFRYGNRAVSRGVSLDIQPGEMIGLVGHSGSGKSTLVNLICRFYDVSEGSIRVDGVDIRSLPVAEYRRNIGLVLQEPFLFFGTIAENIAYGKPDASREEIIAAARAAHAHEFILRLPHGYDSLVGERGQALSGGERQRISIARALLINPRILILDEATSSVDSTTEKEIQKALDNLVKGRTTIAIAHRLSTLRKADRLVVLDRGRVVEEGSHDALMARQGAYWQLYQAQARQAEADRAEAAAEWGVAP